MPTEAAVKAEEALIHVLWINAGLSCDGDSVALTAATQPSIEEIALGALPGLPKIAVHWPLIDFECGPNGGADDFLEWFFKAERGELEPFVLVVEGSIPNEQLHDEGYWCGFGNNPETGQPMTTSEWLDRLAPKATAIVAVGTCATYGGIHAMAGNPTGAMGVPDYLGWEWKSKAGIPIVCVPGCPAHPDNMAETLTYLLYMATEQAPMIPLDEALAAQVAVRGDRARGLRPGRLLRAGRFRDRIRIAEMHCETWLLGPGRQVQRPQAGMDQRYRWVPERRWHLYRMHDARLPGQVHALHGRTAGRQGVDDGVRYVRLRDPHSAPCHGQDGRQRTEVAASRHETHHWSDSHLVGVEPFGAHGRAMARYGEKSCGAWTENRERNFDDNDHPRAVTNQA